MAEDNLDNTLSRKIDKKLREEKDPYLNQYLEQYRIYLHIFNSTNDRSQKSNEFFLGLNAAIIGILGYVETKSLPHGNMIFLLIPFIGISISYSWYKIINSYSILNRAKFKVIHKMEEKLPVALFTKEWSTLNDSKNQHKYVSFSRIEKNIPITFIVLYIVILIVTLWR
jgi:hypothetical protein